MDQPSFAPLTLGTIPAKARKLFGHIHIVLGVPLCIACAGEGR